MDRITLYRRDKKPRKGPRKDWRKLPVSTFVKVFLGLTCIMAALLALLWLTGLADFTAERRYRTVFGLFGDSARRELTMCGFLYTFTPESLKSAGLCIAYNVLPFFLMPGVVLVMLVRRLLGPSRD